MDTIFIQVTVTLMVLFQIKHFLADYLLQNRYMLGKFKEKGWVLPLLSHCGVHAVFTYFIILIVSQSLILALKCAVFDLVTHFIIDRIKASKKLLGRFSINEKGYWLSLGADQFFHHICHYTIIIYLLLCAR